jgi:hypothetical protein
VLPFDKLGFRCGEQSVAVVGSMPWALQAFPPSAGPLTSKVKNLLEACRADLHTANHDMGSGGGTVREQHALDLPYIRGVQLGFTPSGHR